MFNVYFPAFYDRLLSDFYKRRVYSFSSINIGAHSVFIINKLTKKTSRNLKKTDSRWGVAIHHKNNKILRQRGVNCKEGQMVRRGTTRFRLKLQLLQ